MHIGAFYIVNGNMASGKTLLLNILSKSNKKYKGEIFYEDKYLIVITKPIGLVVHPSP